MKINSKMAFFSGFAVLAGVGFVVLALSAGKPQSPDRVAANCTDLAEFKDSCGLQFKYPLSWKVQRNPDNDTLAKISGWTQSGTEGEIVVSVADNPAGLTSEQFARLLDKMLYAKLDSVKKTVIGDVAVGKSGCLKGYAQLINFSVGDYIVTQEFLILPAREKIFTFVLGTRPWERDQAQPVWKQCLSTIAGTKDLFELMSTKDAQALQQKSVQRSCAAGSLSCALPLSKPPANWSLDDKIKTVLPSRDEERFLDIPWEANLLQARRKSANLDKPMFIWIMDGNVLGAT